MAHAFGDVLQALFSRPIRPEAPLPFVPEELDVLIEAWRTAPPVVDHRVSFWQTVAHARCDEVVRARCAPLEPEPWELLSLLRWIVTRETEPDCPAPSALRAPRGELFALAHAAWRWNRVRSNSDGSRLIVSAARLAERLARAPCASADGLLLWMNARSPDALVARARRVVAARRSIGPVRLRGVPLTLVRAELEQQLPT